MKSAGIALAERALRARTGSGAARTASRPSRTTRRSPPARAASDGRSRARPSSSSCGHANSISSTNGRWWSPSSCAGALLQLLEGADHVHVPALAAPHRQRRAPVALARERPVDVVRQPVAEAPVLDVRRVPLHRLVRRQQLARAASWWRCTTTVSRSRAAACRSASSADRSARSPAPAAAARARRGPRSAPPSARGP